MLPIMTTTKARWTLGGGRLILLCLCVVVSAQIQHDSLSSELDGLSATLKRLEGGLGATTQQPTTTRAMPLTLQVQPPQVAGTRFSSPVTLLLNSQSPPQIQPQIVPLRVQPAAVNTLQSNALGSLVINPSLNVAQSAVLPLQPSVQSLTQPGVSSLVQEARSAQQIRDMYMKQAWAARAQRNEAMQETARVLALTGQLSVPPPFSPPQLPPLSPPLSGAPLPITPKKKADDGPWIEVEVVDHTTGEKKHHRVKHDGNVKTSKTSKVKSGAKKSAKKSGLSKAAPSGRGTVGDGGKGNKDVPIVQVKPDPGIPLRYKPSSGSKMRFREVQPSANVSTHDSQRVAQVIAERDAALSKMRQATKTIGTLLSQIHTLSSHKASASSAPPSSLVTEKTINSANADLDSITRRLHTRSGVAVGGNDVAKRQHRKEAIDAEVAHLRKVIKQADMVDAERASLDGERKAFEAEEATERTTLHAAAAHIDALLHMMKAAHTHFTDRANISAISSVDGKASKKAVSQVRHAFDVISKASSKIHEFEEQAEARAHTNATKIQEKRAAVHRRIVAQHHAMEQVNHAASLIQGLLAKIREQKSANIAPTKTAVAPAAMVEVHSTLGDIPKAPNAPPPFPPSGLQVRGQAPSAPRAPRATLPPSPRPRLAIVSDKLTSNEIPTKVRVDIGAPVYSHVDDDATSTLLSSLPSPKPPSLSSPPPPSPRKKQAKRRRRSHTIVHNEETRIVKAQVPQQRKHHRRHHSHRRKRGHHNEDAKKLSVNRATLDAWLKEWEQDWSSETMPIEHVRTLSQRRDALTTQSSQGCTNNKSCGQLPPINPVGKFMALLHQQHMQVLRMPTTFLKTRFSPYHNPVSKKEQLNMAAVLPGAVVKGKHNKYMVPLHAPTSHKIIHQLYLAAVDAAKYSLEQLRDHEVRLVGHIHDAKTSRVQNAYIRSGQQALQVASHIRRFLFIMRHAGAPIPSDLDIIAMQLHESASRAANMSPVAQ